MKLMTTAVLLALCLSVPLYAQVNTDSLKARLVQVKGAERLGVLADLVEALYSEDSERALAYGREAVSLLRGDAAPAVTRRVLYWTGWAYDAAEKYDSAMVLAGRLRTWGEATGVAGGVADGAYLESILYHYERNDQAAAVAAAQEALARYEALGEKRGMAASLNLIGSSYSDLGDYNKALSFYRRALAVREELGDKEGIARSLYNMGSLNWRQGDYAEALSFYGRALALREEIGNKPGMSASINNMGNIYLEQGDYDKALSFYTRSLAIDYYPNTLCLPVYHATATGNRQAGWLSGRKSPFPYIRPLGSAGREGNLRSRRCRF